MDPRTILSVEPLPNDPNHFMAHLSDGTTANVADFIAAPDGLRVELRAADGSGSGDGPLLTPEIRAAFVAHGALVPEASAPIKLTPSAPSAPTPAPMTSVPSVAIPEAPHPSAPAQHHANWLHSLFAALSGAVGLLSSPAVVAILPPKYQGYAEAIAVVEGVVVGATESGTPTTNPFG